MVCHLFVIAPARNYCSKVVLVTHGERGIQDGSVLGAVLGAYDSTQPLMRLRISLGGNYGAVAVNITVCWEETFFNIL